ncbi:hypothetical protein [Streptomyces sp. NPDC057460]
MSLPADRTALDLLDVFHFASLDLPDDEAPRLPAAQGLSGGA